MKIDDEIKRFVIKAMTVTACLIILAGFIIMFASYNELFYDEPKCPFGAGLFHECRR
jgi:nucleoside recognition membrane protein YjiH|tara:strand:+ start:374 stop:544 length:171 start_codon:yes stop_codon:yes gene_type:complete